MIRKISLFVLLVSVGLFQGCGGAGVLVESGAAPVSIQSLSGNGPYEVATYTSFPDVPEFGDATIYYPVNASRAVAGVAIAPGFTEEQRHIAWWGPRLASHGFAVLIMDTNDPRERPEARAEGLISAVRVLRSENGRQGSPLFGRVNVERMAVMGHSMGGGGALIAANNYPDEIQASIPFTPWQPEGRFDRTRAPTLIIAGAADQIAPVAAHAWPHYQSIPASTPRVYMEVDAGDHFIGDTERGVDLETIGRYGIAWLKLYLDGDERYRPFLYGPEQARDSEKFSRYVMGR